MKKIGTLFMLSCLSLQLVSSTVYAEESTTQESTTEKTTESTKESTTESTTESSTTEESTASTEEKEKTEEKDFELNKGIKLTGISSDKEILVDTNGQLKLTTLKLPEGIKDIEKVKTVFKTSDQSIFSIDKEGKWEALKEGKVTIEFGYQLDDETKKALEEAGYKAIDILNKIELTITKKKTEGTAKVQSEGMSIDLKKVIVEGQKYDLKPTVKKSDKKEIAEFIYDYDKDFWTISYNKKTGIGTATAKKSGVTTIKYGYIIKDETESSKDSSSSSSSSTSSSKDSSSSSKDSSSSSTTENTSSTDSTSSTTPSNSETPNSSDKKARMVKESTKESVATLTEADKKNMAKEAIAIKESDEKTFLTNYGMTISPIEPITVGDKGTLADKIKIDFPKGIDFKGTYVFTAPPAMLTINKEGNYEALRDGTVKVSYGYLLDPKVLDELAKDKNFDLMDLATKDKYIEIVIKKSTDNQDERPILHKGMSVLLPETITVGEEYKFKLNTESKLNFEGEFKIDYDKELFDITLNGDEGTLVAKKTGKASFNYGYIPSEKMYQKLVEENDGKALTNDPGTYTIDVQAVQKPAPLQKADAGKNYPQTGEARNNWMLISGIVVIVAAVGGMVWYQSKKKKMTK